jgi:glutathione S-transferase
MHKLSHYRLCPFSRSIRLVLAELGIEVDLAEEQPWEWRPQFLAINPSGDLPVIELEGGPVLCGAYAISEYFAEQMMENTPDGPGVLLFPGTPQERAEVRRLVDWFHGKFDREVTRELLNEKVYPRGSARPTPEPDVMRAIRANLRYHMSYIGYLADRRRWLAGEEMSFADLAAAAHLSSVDYLGEAPWEQYPAAKTWYSRVKSRRCFRPLLADLIPGPRPPLHYAALDF